MVKYFKAPVEFINVVGETTTQERSITVDADSSVKISLFVPRVAAGIRVYRSTASNAETLLLDIALPESFRNQPSVSAFMEFVDSGTLSPGVTPYPETTNLSSAELSVVPEPDFALSSGSGQLGAGEYFYRVSFYTVIDFAPKFIPTEDTSYRYYRPDAGEIFLMSGSDLSLIDPSYEEVMNPFAYVSAISPTLLFNNVTVDGESRLEQSVFVGSGFRKKYMAPLQTVSIKTDSAVYTAGSPVFLSLSPPGVSVEVLENTLKGTPQILRSTSIRVYDSEQSISFFASDNTKLLYVLSGGSFKVVS